MKEVTWELTKENYEKAKKDGIVSILPDEITMGYGYYGGRLKEEDGNYILTFSMGDSCD